MYLYIINRHETKFPITSLFPAQIKYYYIRNIKQINQQIESYRVVYITSNFTWLVILSIIYITSYLKKIKFVLIFRQFHRFQIPKREGHIFFYNIADKNDKCSRRDNIDNIQLRTSTTSPWKFKRRWVRNYFFLSFFSTRSMKPCK